MMNIFWLQRSTALQLPVLIYFIVFGGTALPIEIIKFYESYAARNIIFYDSLVIVISGEFMTCP